MLSETYGDYTSSICEYWFRRYNKSDFNMEDKKAKTIWRWEMEALLDQDPIIDYEWDELLPIVVIEAQPLVVLIGQHWSCSC